VFRSKCNIQAALPPTGRAFAFEVKCFGRSRDEKTSREGWTVQPWRGEVGKEVGARAAVAFFQSRNTRPSLCVLDEDHVKKNSYRGFARFAARVDSSCECAPSQELSARGFQVCRVNGDAGVPDERFRPRTPSRPGAPLAPKCPH